MRTPLINQTLSIAPCVVLLLPLALATSHARTMHAQSNAAAPQTQPSEEVEEITVVGCLRRLDTSGRRAGTTGSTPPATSYRAESGFTLKNAQVMKDGKPVGVAPEREFGLATKDVKLDPYDKHQVEIKGHFVPDDEQPGGTKADKPKASDLRSLTVGGNDILVRSIRSLAPDCPPRVP